MELSLGEIMREYGGEYREKYAAKMLPSHRKAMKAIAECRTEALGGHIYDCEPCDKVEYRYHSCRNRNCPLCQHEQTREWLEGQAKLLLPVDYFLLTFTIPAGLREVARSNQKVFYDMLFRITAAASQELAKDRRYVGGQLGMMGVLHTWTRNLAFHPHIHYVMPGGGVSTSGEWVAARWRKFLFPVKALSKLVRGKFHSALRKANLDANVPEDVWQQEWVVHCKPAGNGEAVLKYLAPYVFHTAISNRRLVKLVDHGSMSNSLITFSYRTTDTGESKTMTLPVEAFLQRFLQHVLPKGFVKVRYFGFLVASQRTKLTVLRLRLQPEAAITPTISSEKEQRTDEQKALAQVLCPDCKQPMRLRTSLPRRSANRSP